MSDDESTKVTITLRTIVTGPEAGCIIGREGRLSTPSETRAGPRSK